MATVVLEQGRATEMEIPDVLPADIGITQKLCLMPFWKPSSCLKLNWMKLVLDVLSRTVQVIGVSQIELIKERFLLELRQKKEECISDYSRRVGVFKTLALKKFSEEHWACNCLSGLNDECFRDVVKDHVQITLIVQELERQDCLDKQLNGLFGQNASSSTSSR